MGNISVNEDFSSLVRDLENLPREEFMKVLNEFVANNTTPQEARALEVSSQLRLKNLQLEDESLVPKKMSLGYTPKGFRLQFRENGQITSKRLGKELPEDFDLSQYTLSPSAREQLKKV